MASPFAVVVEHDGVGGVGGIAAAGPAEGAHLGAGGDAGVEPDEGEVRRVVHDGGGELADPLAVGALGHGAAPPGPDLLPQPDRPRADAVAGGADVAGAVGGPEQEVERAPPDLGTSRPPAGSTSRVDVSW
jgi:hypothetical protein